MSNAESKLIELGIVLPEPPQPVASYLLSRQVHHLIYTSGQDCRVNGTLKYKGKLGAQLTVEQGHDAARQTMINLLAVLKAELKDLDRVKRVVKLLGLVNSAPGFVEQPYVMNGASDLLIAVFADKGRHARSAVAANELPFDTPVEIEMIVEVEV